MTVYANNVAGVLAAGIGPSDTMLVLSAGQGAFFPAPGTDYYWVTLIHPTTYALEIVQVTAKSGDTLTVVRGRDGTTAIAYPTGTILEMRLTAQMMREVNYRAVINAANGVAGLDASARLLPAQMPLTVPLMVGGFLPLELMPASLATQSELDTAVAALQAVDATRVNKAGDNMSGTLGLKVGAFGVQQGLLAMGWNNGVTRWFWVMEADGALALYAYDTTGAAATQAMRFSGGVAGGQVGLRVGGAVVWHANNFDPNLKANNQNPAITDMRAFRSGFDGGQGIIYWGGNGPYQLFDGANFSFSHNVYAPNLVGTSDENLKKNIRRAPAVSKIGDMVNLISWEWRQRKMKGAAKGRHRGVSAQAVRKYAPHHVHEGPGGQLGVDKAGLALEVAVDDAARILKLEAQVEELQALVRQLIKKTR